MVSTSQKISCLLARISPFPGNFFPPNFNNGFHQQRNSSDQKTLFALDRNPVFTVGIKDLLKLVSNSRKEGLAEKYVPIEERTVSTGSSCLLSEKMKEIEFQQAENQLHGLKYALSFTIGFHWFQSRFSLERKTSEQRKMVSTSQKLSCPLAGIIFPQQEFFLKIGFRLISIMLSTSRQEAAKSVPSQNNATI